jgi:hypothetical protein
MMRILSLQQFVADFAAGMKAVDVRMPQAQNIRSKMFFKAGIGPLCLGSPNDWAWAIEVKMLGGPI